MYCPIKPAGSAGGIRDCYGSHCVFADDKGGCLIADALALYVEEKEKLLTDSKIQNTAMDKSC